MKLWGGRFKKPTAPEMERLGSSIDFDRRMTGDDDRHVGHVLTLFDQSGVRLEMHTIGDAGDELQMATLERAEQAHAKNGNSQTLHLT